MINIENSIHKISFVNINLANSLFKRFQGLMMKKSFGTSGGLLLKNCSSIHCFFMRFPIDVVYFDNEYSVVAKETVYPWHIGKRFKEAKHVLELPINAAKKVQPGMIFQVKAGDFNE